MTEPAFFTAHRRGAPWRERAAWPFAWVTGDEVPPTVGAFRLRFSSPTAENLRLIVTADERYRLYLDGQLVRSGPEIGTRWRWQADSIELDLAAGEHQLLAIVWSTGHERGDFSTDGISHSFALGVDGPANPRLATGTAAWEWHHLPGYTFIKSPLSRWCVPDVHRDATKTDWSVEVGAGDGWRPVRVVSPVQHVADVGAAPARYVEVGALPPPLHRRWNSLRVRHAELLPLGSDRTKVPLTANDPSSAARWTEAITTGSTLTVPPRTMLRVVMDCDDYVTAWPEFTAGGAGATVVVEWMEALSLNPVTEPTMVKGNRNEITGRYAFGLADHIRCDATPRWWRPLFWRAGRFIIITISTDAAPATFSGLTLYEDRYPLEQEATIDVAHPGLTRAFPICLRTLQTNAHDLFSDTPYYERLQYMGDTRIDCLINYVLCRDRRLPVKVLRMVDSQRMPDGLTVSRCPTRVIQVIPPFSLWYIGMAHDHLWWNGNHQVIRNLMPGIRGVIEAFLINRRDDGTIGFMEGWNFTDWVSNFPEGEVPGTSTGSSHSSLQLLMALAWVEDLETAFGEVEMAARCRRLRTEVTRGIETVFWNEARGAWADDRAHTSFSQHAQALAALCPDLSATKRERGLTCLRNDRTLAPASVYFSHYLMEAWAATGDGQSIADAFGFWAALPDQGFKTLPEHPEPSRSDCHAWGAHPLYHTVASIAGIRPSAPGFKRVRVAPCLGAIPSVHVRIPHPDGGWIAASLNAANGSLHGTITLPTGITGNLVWKQHEIALKNGENAIAID
ncbi:MAG: alpha-L-rhamnosidase C-terminal domain-containing protein [Planctomycetota bacterium]